MMEEKGLIISLVLGFVFLIVGTIIAFVIISNVSEVYDGVSTDTTISATQSVLTFSTATLSPIGDGITSSSITRNNRTWLEFDGVNDGVDITHSMFDFDKYGDAFTITFWTNVSTTSSDTRFINTYPNTFGQGFQFQTNKTATKLFLERGTSGGDCEQGGTANLNDGVWNFVALTYNGSSLNITMDNIEVYSNISYSASCSLGWDSAGDFWIGGGGHSGNTINGAMDEVRIYNHSLSSSKITEIYNSGRIQNFSLPLAGLLAWLPLNEGSGTDVHSFNESDFT